MGRKILIDVDTGIDDAMALLLLFSQTEEDEVLGISCVCGNTALDNVLKNTLHILSVCGRLDVPVYPGAVKPLVTDVPICTYHGSDGLANMKNRKPVDLNVVKKEHASQAMVRLVNQNPGEITLICVGPLTNLAIAQKIDSDIGKKLNKLVIMGGSSAGIGNQTLYGEFNFTADPEAAQVVLNEVKCSKYLVTLELYKRERFPVDLPKSWFTLQTEQAKLMQEFMSFLYPNGVDQLSSWGTCDPLAVAVGLDPDLVTEKSDLYATVATSGKLLKGMLIIDWENQLQKEANIHLVNKLEYSVLKTMMYNMVK